MTRETDDVGQDLSNIFFVFFGKNEVVKLVFCKKTKNTSFFCVFPEKIRNNSFFCVFPAKKQFFPPKSTLRRSFVDAMKI